MILGATINAEYVTTALATHAASAEIREANFTATTVALSPAVIKVDAPTAAKYRVDNDAIAAGQTTQDGVQSPKPRLGRRHVHLFRLECGKIFRLLKGPFVIFAAIDNLDSFDKDADIARAQKRGKFGDETVDPLGPAAGTNRDFVKGQVFGKRQIRKDIIGDIPAPAFA